VKAQIENVWRSGADALLISAKSGSV